MKSRAAALALVVIGAVAMMATTPAGTPPVYLYAGVTVSDPVLDPVPAVAGQTLTMQFVTTHDVGANAATFALKDPVGTYLPAGYGCGTPESQTWSPEAPVRTVTMSCTLPAIVPNGDWTLELSVYATSSPVTTLSVPFIVVGGSTDVEPPAQLSASPSQHYDAPDLVLNQEFELTAVLHEEHGPITVVQNPQSGADCDQPVAITQLDATTWQLTATCRATDPDYPYPRPYFFEFRLTDALGHSRAIWWAFYLAPP